MSKSAKTYIIAEIGVNHNGSMDLARELIDVAADCGADAVKFQTFTADELVTKKAAKATYQKETTDAEQSQYEMLDALALDEDQFAELSAYCSTKNIEFLSTPFSFKSSDLLERIGVNAYKVSSGDLTYSEFLKHLGRKQKPVIISTGMATISEVETAVRALESTGLKDISILHCVSNYPANPADCNLKAMDTLSRCFGYPVGWSDHSQGPALSLAAVALGAQIIEKHITLDCAMEGPDHRASMEPAEFKTMVCDIRDIERALGDGCKKPTPSEADTAQVARRSIVAKGDLQKGHVIAEADLDVLRPGTGLKPDQLQEIVGLVLAEAAAEGTPLTMDHFK